MSLLVKPLVGPLVSPLTYIPESAINLFHSGTEDPTESEDIMFLTRVVELGVDAVATPYAISIPFTGQPGRVIRLEANIKALSMFSGNGYVKFHLATKNSSGVFEQEDIKTQGIFEMDDPAPNRDFHMFIDFEKSASGSLDVEIQFLGALGVITTSNVELIITDLGGTETAPVAPQIVSSIVEDNLRGQIKVLTSRNMSSTALDGFSVVGKTISSLQFQQTELLILLTTDYDYLDTVQWAYDAAVSGSDFKAIDDSEELLSGTFNGSNFTNKPPVVVGDVNLGILLQSASPKTWTDAELLTTSTDPEGTVLVVDNISVASGSGSIVDNLDNTHTFTEAGTGAVVLNYDANDGEYDTAVVANIDVQTAVSTEMGFVTFGVATTKRIDFQMDENVDNTQFTSEQSAIPGFQVTGGLTIDRVKQNNPGNAIINMYMNETIPFDVPFTLTYTKANLSAATQILGASGKDFPDGPLALERTA